MKHRRSPTRRAWHGVLGCSLVCAAALCTAAGVVAQGLTPLVPANLFVQALSDGAAAMPLPDQPELRDFRTRLEQQLGSQAPLELRAMRILRFKQQPSCGRVAFGLWQPQTRRVVAAVAGQLNICEDGRPPLQECPAKPGTLVPAGSTCLDPSGQRHAAQDTAEVRQAIQGAVAQGGLSVEQIRATRKPASGAAQ